MAAPDDAATVLAAVRLGFCMAEVRGRNRPDAPPGSQLRVIYSRNTSELPLQFERTAGESRVGAQEVLIALAGKLKVDSSGQQSSYSHEVSSQARSLAVARLEGDGQAAAQKWGSLADLIYMFDGHIQDTLSVESDQACDGYQLGRALAEPYWALDPSLLDTPPMWGSWASLLSPERCDEIESLLGRLSDYLPSPYTARAIAGSVRKWQEVAASESWRRDTVPKLYEQVSIWHELAALGRDPDTYVKAYARLQNIRILNRAIRFFWGEMLLIALGIAALIVLVVYLGSGAGTAVVNTVLGILAAAGVTTAGLSAGRFRRDLNTDLLTRAITKLPPRPKKA